jgi:hypothetical protein
VIPRVKAAIQEDYEPYYGENYDEKKAKDTIEKNHGSLIEGDAFD